MSYCLDCHTLDKLVSFKGHQPYSLPLSHKEDTMLMLVNGRNDGRTGQ